MPKEEPKSSTALAERPRDRRPRPFKAPAEFPPQLGVQIMDETHIQGVVSTDNIRTLLDAFGISQQEHITIPFHFVKTEHGERWSLRVENSAVHQVDAKPVVGHTWIYRREYPEQSVGN